MSSPQLTIRDYVPTFREKANSTPKHLPFLDGIRALMCIWVALGHAFQDFIHVVDNRAGSTYFLPQPFYQEAFFAHFAVDVFIVLSGFCLMLPVVRTSGFHLSGGWRNYLQRRAKRILPPYYAALLLAGLLSLLRYEITFPNPESSAIHIIDFRPTAIIAHLLLVQNMWDPWARALDGPTWSVATEFQIYLFFPALLLPLWRRVRPAWVIMLMSVIGVLIYKFTPFGLSSCSWYIGLFAMGMLAAEWFTRSAMSNVRPGLLYCAVSLLSIALYLIAIENWMPEYMWALDLLIGAATALLLAYFASEGNSEKGAAVKLLEWPPLVALGTFSYSFYLIHAPLLNLPVTLLLKYRANGYVGAVVICLSLFVIGCIARLFYLHIELPSMAKKPGPQISEGIVS